MRFRRRNRIKDEATIDLTPMLDIVFIMLIFFIVTSKYVQESAVELVKPSAEHTQDVEPHDLTLVLDANHQVYLNDKLLTIDNLLTVLKQEKDAADKIMSHVHLLILADQNTKNGVLVELMDLAQSVGIGSISLGVDKKGLTK